MLRDKPEDAPLVEYCASLEKELKALGLRVLVDSKPIKSAEKRWGWAVSYTHLTLPTIYSV